MQTYLDRRPTAGLVAQASDFPADWAALPIVMSAAVIAIAGGTENSHCSATGALSGDDSMFRENTPGVLSSV